MSGSTVLIVDDEHTLARSAKAFLAENPEVMVEISERIRTEVGLTRPEADASAVVSPNGSDPDDEPITLD